MVISRQIESGDEMLRGPRARTRRLMLATAKELMQSGQVPSVSEVAESAQVSRATAYRYFPSQAALVEAVVDEALGPILQWRSESSDAGQRVADLIETSMPRIESYEATFRAALKVALDQHVTDKDTEPGFTRGHRVDLLRDALRPMTGSYDQREIDLLAQSLSLIFGIEALVVLKDIWGLDSRQMRKVMLWAAATLAGGMQARGRVSKGLEV